MNFKNIKISLLLAGIRGLEPLTSRLTAERSTIELWDINFGK